MTWLAAYENLINHPKTAMLGRSMVWNKYEAAGRLLAFWFWCLEYAPTGDLRRFNDTQLGSAVELDDESATKFVRNMVGSGWIDRKKRRFRVHNWFDRQRIFLKNHRFNGRPEKWLEVLRTYNDDSRAAQELLSAQNKPDQHTRSPQAPRKRGVREVSPESRAEKNHRRRMAEIESLSK